MPHQAPKNFAWMVLTAKTAESIMAMNRRFQIVFWNSPAERLTGYPAGEVLGRACYDVMQGMDRSYQTFCRPGCSLASAADTGRPISACVLICPHGPGHSSRYLVSSMRLHTEDGPFLAHFFHETGWIAGSRWDVAVTSPPPPEHGLAKFSLTSREREVLALLTQGRTTRQVSAELHITYATARNHVQRVLEKLGVHSRMEAVLAAMTHPDHRETPS